jgi:hypothetical protein
MIDMLRRTACAVAGIAIACTAGYVISLTVQPRASADLDLRWMHSSAKQDRLTLDPGWRGGGTAVSFDLPSHGTTIVTREPVRPTVEGAVRTPRPVPVRTIQVAPVREAPNEKAAKERLPEGCEPAFSPVTTPALAHIGVRCDS